MKKAFTPQTPHHKRSFSFIYFFIPLYYVNYQY